MVNIYKISPSGQIQKKDMEVILLLGTL